MFCNSIHFKILVILWSINIHLAFFNHRHHCQPATTGTAVHQQPFTFYRMPTVYSCTFWHYSTLPAMSQLSPPCAALSLMLLSSLLQMLYPINCLIQEESNVLLGGLHANNGNAYKQRATHLECINSCLKSAIIYHW